MDSELKNEYLNASENYVKKVHHGTKLSSYRNNWFFVYWNILVTLVSIYLVFLVSDNSLSLTMYLILVPYFSTSMSEINEFFKLFTELKTTEVAVQRINSILNFSEKEMIEFGSNISENVKGDLVFKNVTAAAKKGDDFQFENIYSADFKISHGEIAVFWGLGASGKRAIFYLLRRVIKPNSGTILLDNINIYDYSREVYSNNISFTTSNPFFFEGSIMKNMLAVNDKISKQDVYDMCKKLNIHEYIKNLPNKYETNLNREADLFSEEKWFLISLACVLLSKSNVIMIYELPVSLSAKEIEGIKEIFVKFKNEKTILIFTANNIYSEIATSVYKVEDNKVHII